MEDALEKQRATGAEELSVHGVEVSQASVMLIVGAVEQLIRQASSLQFVLNDSTGRIRVRHYTTSDAGSAGLDRIVDGGYVTIVGNVRTSPTMHVSATFLHPVTSPDDVSYHMIEAAQAGLKLRQVAAGVKPFAPASLTAPARTTGPALGEVASVPTPQRQQHPQEVPGAAAQPAQRAVPPADTAHVAPTQAVAAIKDVVFAFLKREAEGNEAGLHIDTVCAGVKADASAIRAALAALVDDSEVYNTLDENHFAPL